MISVYTDGSWILREPNRCAWGVVIDCEQGYEFNGTLKLPVSMAGLYEIVAFIEATVRLNDMGVAPNECQFICDDEVLVYGSQCTPERGAAKSSWSNALDKSLQRISSHYSSDVLNLAKLYLAMSQFNKVLAHKSHTWCVNNRRADYLARCALNNKRKLRYITWVHLLWDSSLLPYDDVKSSHKRREY